MSHWTSTTQGLATLGLAAALCCQAIAAPDAFIHYRARQGDTLIGLGQTMLERPSDWPALAQLNRIRNPRRIPVGTALKIPVDLLKTRAVAASVINALGHSEVSPPGGVIGVVQTGTRIEQGTEIRTGPQSYVTVKLADGSVLRLQPSTVVQLERSRQYESAGFFASRLRLLQGRIEALVAHLTGGEPRFEIQTPQAVMGVRGTDFRTTVLPDQAQTLSEVLDGAVAVNVARSMSTTSPVMLAGHGTRIDADTRQPVITALLPAPDLTALPQLHERLLVRLNWPPVKGALRYRGQIARDADFREVVSEITASSPEWRVADLPDGHYHLRVRAIDAQGIEGLNADAGWQLKARPEPPIATQPGAAAKLRAERITLAWTEQGEASTYRLQITEAHAPAGFAQPLHEQQGIRASTWSLPLPPGDYLWRLASTRANGDRGPWGDAQAFVVRPLPPPPMPPKVGARTLDFSWTGEPGQRFEFQISRSPTFLTDTHTYAVTQPTLTIDKPQEGGRLHVRYRAVDADGYVGPYTTPQILDLPACARDGQGECIQTVQAGILEGR